jgi:hypothetical protein
MHWRRAWTTITRVVTLEVKNYACLDANNSLGRFKVTLQTYVED